MRLALRLPTIVLAALVVALWIARARLLTTTNINWDEFHFLSQVHAYLRGELSAKLLTFHVHFFTWIGGVSPNEADQVLAMRTVLFGLSLVSSAAIAFIAWRLFRDVNAALFTLFVGESTAYVMRHGASARFDSLVAPLFSLSAAILVGKRTASGAATAGALYAVALVVSIKAAVFLPVFAGIALASAIGGGRPALRRALVELAWFTGFALATFLALYAVHTLSLAPPPDDLVLRGKPSTLFEVAQRQLAGKLLPNDSALVSTLRWDAFFWLLVAAGAALAFVGIGAGGGARRAGALTLCFALPLTTIALYRNAFPYYYVCLLPPAALLAGLAAARVQGALAARAPLVAGLLVVALAVPSAVQARRYVAYNGGDEVSFQADVVDAVHAVFPEPVPYIDRGGMIASFPMVGMFMTTFVLDKYRANAKPVFRELLAKRRPQFVLTNVETLDLGASYGKKASRRLLRDDFTALRDSYVKHWGPIWVAGKHLALAGAPVSFEVLVAGDYVVEGAPVTLDGHPLAPGDIVTVAAGAHTATGSAPVTLRIASARPPPATKPVEGRLFTSLGFKSEPPPR